MRQKQRSKSKGRDARGASLLHSQRVQHPPLTHLTLLCSLCLPLQPDLFLSSPLLCSAAMSFVAPLAELLELSVYVADSVRFPGTTLRGSLTVSVPTRRSLRALAGIGADVDEADGGSAAAAGFAAIAATSAGAAVAPANAHGQSISSPLESRPLLSLSGAQSATASALLPSPPLSRSFPFELKLQLMGKAVWDPSKLSATAMRRFASNASGANAFRIWSTRVLNISVDKEQCKHMPRTCQPPERTTRLQRDACATPLRSPVLICFCAPVGCLF